MKRRPGFIITRDIYDKMHDYKNRECKTLVSAATYLVNRSIFKNDLDKIDQIVINKRINKRLESSHNPKIDLIITDKNYDTIKGVADKFNCKSCHVIECLIEDRLRLEYDKYPC
jgi:hypothetical protein